MSTRSASPASVDAAMAIVRAHGLRASSARRLVLAALLGTDRPVSAERIARGLDGELPVSDIGSVYRNLETLEQLGLVRHLHVGHGPTLYAIAHAGDEGYLACERCGEVRTVNPQAVAVIRGAVQKAFGLEASFLHFPIVGVCASCAKEER